MGVHGGLGKHLVKATSSYRPDIDGLRAFAVLSVIAFHAVPMRLLGGFVGVDVFFVLSGYLIAGTFSTRSNRGGFAPPLLRQAHPSHLSHVGDRARRLPRRRLVRLLVDEYMMLGLHTARGAGFASNLILWTESGHFDTPQSPSHCCISDPWDPGHQGATLHGLALVAHALWANRTPSGRSPTPSICQILVRSSTTRTSLSAPTKHASSSAPTLVTIPKASAQSAKLYVDWARQNGSGRADTIFD
ncbi:acyltransferase family protein [Devosia sp. Root685]|uniref:acyltransferase family protein n=1 Tax=Devosia sp. Root685 TaxID=1736587 RepID=UPI000A6F35DE|nr:acyltransferase [Devosia sp. Root685]